MSATPTTCRAPTARRTAPPARRSRISTASNGRSSPTPPPSPAALQNGEIDWWLTPNADLLPLLQQQARLKVETIDPTGIDRHDALQPAQSAVRQSGDPPRDAGRGRAVRLHDRRWSAPTQTLWRDRRRLSSVPDTPLATDAGMEALTGKRDLAKVKRDIEAAGYKGEKVVVLTPTDIPWSKALADITADRLQPRRA